MGLPDQREPFECKRADLTDAGDEKAMNGVHCLCPRIFGRIIADAAQKLKSPARVTYRSVYDLQVPSYVLLTTTPMIHQSIDLIDLLALFWQDL